MAALISQSSQVSQNKFLLESIKKDDFQSLVCNLKALKNQYSVKVKLKYLCDYLLSTKKELQHAFCVITVTS